jgi:hypothetical protein
MKKKGGKKKKSKAAKDKQKDKQKTDFKSNISRYLMVGIAVIAFSASIVTAVTGIYAWREQKMVEENLESAKEIREMYREMDLSTPEVIGIHWDEYVDEDVGYSFLYPSFWYLSEGSSSVKDVSNTEDPNEKDVSVIRFQVDEFQDTAPTPEDVVAESELYAQEYDQSEFIIDGETGILLYPKEEVETFGGIVFVNCGKNQYRISWGSSTPEAAKEHEAVMRIIAESLKFTGDCSSSQ